MRTLWRLWILVLMFGNAMLCVANVSVGNYIMAAFCAAAFVVYIHTLTEDW